MKKIIFLALGCSLLFTPSCKDFLQKDPTGSPSEAIFWQTKEDFNLALTAVYRDMLGSISSNQSGPQAYNNFLSTYYANWDNLTDNAVSKISYDNAENIVRDLISPSDLGGLADIYGGCYSKIARINIFIDKLDSFFTDNNEDADYKHMKGEALALRGMYYHYLYTCYGAVPVVKYAVNVDDMFEDVSPKEKVYEAAIEDFDAAIAILGLTETYMSKPGRMTGAAAVAFRARTKLYHAYNDQGVADKTQMATILSELNAIPAGSYQVEADPLTNFHTGTQSASKEIMFSARFLKPTMRNQIDLFVGNWKSIQPTRDLVYAFPMADGNTPYTPDPTIEAEMYPDPEVREKAIEELRKKLKGEGKSEEDIEKAVKEFNKQEDDKLAAIYDKIFVGRDMRLSKFIAHNDRYNFTGYVAGAVTFEDGEKSSTKFNVNKLLTPIDGTKEKSWNNGYEWQGDQDVVLMRWGQVLLMKAEAAFESGDENAAKGYINELRAPRNIPALNNIDRDILRNEIRIETCFEGQRYFDMKRWRILGTMNGKLQDPSQKGGYDVVINPAHFDWPIPQGQIDIYENNGHVLTQNPNYK